MVPLIKGDWRFQLVEEGGDSHLSGACFPIVYLVLALGPDGVGSAEDHDAFLRVGEAVFVLARHASFLGYRLFATSFFWPVGLS